VRSSIKDNISFINNISTFYRITSYFLGSIAATSDACSKEEKFISFLSMHFDLSRLCIPLFSLKKMRKENRNNKRVLYNKVSEYFSSSRRLAAAVITTIHNNDDDEHKYKSEKCYLKLHLIVRCASDKNLLIGVYWLQKILIALHDKIIYDIHCF
jgi:hypothetical protein